MVPDRQFWWSGPCVGAYRTTLNWEPYAGENLPGQGFTTKIVVKAFERAGYSASVTFLPWKRTLAEVAQGKFDGVYCAYYSEERAKTYLVSDAFANGPLMLCSQKGRNIQYKTIKDLQPYTIGTVMGYVNTEEFDKADYLKKDAVTSDLINLKKLLAGRVDLISIDKYVALHALNTNPELKGGLDKIEFLSPPLNDLPLYLLISKAIADGPQKLKDFNEGLKAIKADGTVSNILKEYGYWVQ